MEGGKKEWRRKRRWKGGVEKGRQRSRRLMKKVKWRLPVKVGKKSQGEHAVVKRLPLFRRYSKHIPLVVFRCRRRRGQESAGLGPQQHNKFARGQDVEPRSLMT